MTQTLTRGTETTVGRAVGQPVDRIDGTAKATGTAAYAADYSYPELAHAALVHATVARGRITTIDTGEAATVSGVLAVLTHENAPPMRLPRSRNPMSVASGAPVNYLHTDEVHWNGQPVAMVVAATLAAAEEAAALVRVHCEPIAMTVDFAAEQRNAKPAPGIPLVMPARRHRGDAVAALAEAPVSVDISVTTPPYNHNALEPHATTAAWDGDRLTVHDATQGIDLVRRDLAQRFAVPVANVTVIAPYVGGGFGGKGKVWPSTVLAPLAARAVGKPVRLVLTREGVYRSVGGRAPTVQRVAIGAERDGEITALVHTGVSATGRLGGFGDNPTWETEHLYAARTMLLEGSVIELDVIPNAPMRAPGSAVGMAALELAVDELASALGVDPIDLRMRNEPERTAIGERRLSHRSLRELYERGAREFGWHSRDPEPGSMRDGRWLVGMGVASAAHLAGALTADVTVRLRADGTVRIRCGFQDAGMGTATAVAQVAADELGVPVEAVEMKYGDSTHPRAPAAIGSMHTASVVNGVLAACVKLRRRLDTLAARAGAAGDGYPAVLRREMSPYLEASVGEGTLAHGVNQARAFGRALRDLRRLARFSSGAHFCEVRVDPDTGEVGVSRWLGVFDVGTALNEKLVASQLRGGIVMGIGMALSEETLIDPRTGRIMNPHLSDYHVPVHADVPPIEIRYLGDPDPTMPAGMYGIGELSICGAPAAIANAVHHATGRRIRDFPLTPDKVLGLREM
jgi:xanthine dehydrogenase YagR molybdenum-binding subunit